MRFLVLALSEFLEQCKHSKVQALPTNPRHHVTKNNETKSGFNETICDGGGGKHLRNLIIL